MKTEKKSLTVRELLEAGGGLRKLAVQDIPGPEAYRCAMIVKAADVHIGLYEEQYAKALSKYCAEETDGRWKAKSPEDREAFDRAVDELRQIEVELEIPVCRIRLGDVKLSGIDVIALEKLIEFEDGEEDEHERDHHQRAE